MNSDKFAVTHRRLLPMLAAVIMAAPLPTAAQGTAAAGDWPSRPIHLILPYAPGATADAFARAVGPRLAESLGQPVVIENRPGAGGAIGSAQVAKSAPDGYNLLVTFSTHYSLPFLQKAVPNDPVRDFTPIIAAATIQTVVAVHPSHPAKTMAEFLSQARATPQGVLYGTGGLVLFGELLAQTAGIRMIHVPYKGGGPMLADLLGGQITTGLTVLSTAMPHVKANRLRVLAVMSDKRARIAPDIPALTETLPDYSMADSWVGVLGPAGMPRPLVNRIHAEVKKTLDAAAVRDLLNGAGFEVTGNLSPEQLAESVVKTVEVFRRVTANARIVPE